MHIPTDPSPDRRLRSSVRLETARAHAWSLPDILVAMSWMTQQQIAGVMGYLSIACWLCAQLPQVIKNARLKSCEGLALPFLINWLFGELRPRGFDRS